MTALPPTAPSDQGADPGRQPIVEVGPSSAAAAATTETERPALSKKAQKRLAKQELLHAKKLARRAREKEAKKAKKAEKRKAIEAGLISREEEEEMKRKKRPRKEDVHEFGATIVVDLSFDELMTDKEIVSMSSQLAYTYSSNRSSTNPFASLIFAPLNGRLKTRFDKLHGTARSWRRVHIVDGEDGRGLETLWTPREGTENAVSNAENGDDETNVVADTSAANTDRPEDVGRGEGDRMEDETSDGGAQAQAAEICEPNPSGKSGPSKSRPAPRSLPLPLDKEKVIYLTADSEDTVERLEEGHTYVLGGIVDRNRYKNLCLNRAREHGLRTARLPISAETLSRHLPSRKVLTVNQVFDILLAWVRERDWSRALQVGIPSRKFHAGGGGKKGNSDVEQEREGGEGGVEEEVVGREGEEGKEEGGGDEDGDGDGDEDGDGDRDGDEDGDGRRTS